MNVATEEPRVTIHCPTCGHDREISARQRRRISNKIHDDRCYWCRTGTNRRNPDRYLRYWLLLAEVTIPPNVSPRDYIAAYGVPAELLELAYGMWPELA